MKFKLEIELGNEAMQSGYDVAQALKEQLKYLEGIEGKLMRRECGKIRDLNGNTVGEWKVVGR